MPLDTQEYVPGMSDTAVKAKTGKDWAGWFGALDRAGAAKLRHPQIAQLLHEKHGMPGWWCQMVTVEYELARGLRVRHQTATGFSASVSKTIATSVSALYTATANAAKRKQWFPRGDARAFVADQGQVFPRLVERHCAAGDRLLSERGQSADRRPGEKAREACGCRSRKAAWKAALEKLREELRAEAAMTLQRGRSVI